MRTRACFAHAMPILFGRAPTRGATSALICTRIANAKINAEFGGLLLNNQWRYFDELHPSVVVLQNEKPNL
jgi:hypothetical protein